MELMPHASAKPLWLHQRVKRQRGPIGAERRSRCEGDRVQVGSALQVQPSSPRAGDRLRRLSPHSTRCFDRRCSGTCVPFAQLNVSHPAAPASAPGGTWTLGARRLPLSVSMTTCIRQHPACHTLLRLRVPSHVSAIRSETWRPGRVQLARLCIPGASWGDERLDERTHSQGHPAGGSAGRRRQKPG